MKQESNGGARAAGGRTGGPAALAAALLALFIYAAIHTAPASAMQVLDAVDHAELTAEVSARAVSRIAVAGDRIARVVRSPDGFRVEHDAANGDLYLRPLAAGAGAPGAAPGTGAPAAPEPVTLFVGTEKGFTYRLTLAVADRGSAQILIRNAGAGALAAGSAANTSGPRIAALVKLIRAVARREPLAGYAIEAVRGGEGNGTAGAVRIVETWRGPRFEALVLALGSGGPVDAAALATRLAPGSGSGAGPGSRLGESLPRPPSRGDRPESGTGPGVAAAWVAAPGTGPSGGRLAVVVRERAPARSPGQAGGLR